MKFEPIPAHESLHQFVRNYWILTSRCTAPGTQRILSNGATSLHFYISQNVHLDNEERAYRTALNHHDLAVMDIKTTEGDFNVFGVEFVPFGTRAFFNMSNHTEPHINPEDLGDKEFIALDEKIHNARDNEERRQLMDEFLIKRMEQKIATGINMQRMEDVFDDIDESNTTGDMASNACLGPKQFTRVFSEYVGMSPKSYQRLLRFHRALAQMNEGKDSLSDIAYDCGYYDLAHMANDFHQLCGYSPSDLLAMGDKLTEVFQNTFTQSMKKKIQIENLE